MPDLGSQLIIGTTQVPTNAIGTTEIDELVKKVSESLQLKATEKKRVNNRASPYQACKHCQTLHCIKDCYYLRRTHSGHIKKRNDTDAHKLLEKLLRQGNLIKEAVGRLSNVSFHSQPKCKFSSSYVSDAEDESDTGESPPTLAC